MSIAVDAFTAIRPEELKEMGGKGPMTRAQRKAAKRKAQLEQSGDNSNETPSSEPTYIHLEDPNDIGSSSGGTSPSSIDETPTETPTVDPLEEQQKEIEKRKEETKRSNMIAGIIFFIIIAGVAGWYFTRNMNFKNLKK